MKNHTHKGVERSNGSLRSHPMKRLHKTKKVQIYHNRSLKNNDKKKFFQGSTGIISTLKRAITEKKLPKKATCLIDTDGYVSIDLDNVHSDIIGLRVKFTRIEGNKKRRVALAINK